jgi:hypothetical protein
MGENVNAAASFAIVRPVRWQTTRGVIRVISLAPVVEVCLRACLANSSCPAADRMKSNELLHCAQNSKLTSALHGEHREENVQLACG